MTALEMQFAATRVIERQLRKHPKNVSGLMTIDALRGAETYSWSHATAEATRLASKTIPLGIKAPLASLPSPKGWFWLGTDFRHGDCHALAWRWTSALQLFAFKVEDGDTGIYAPLPSMFWFWDEHETLGELIARTREKQETRDPFPVAELSAFFAASCAWLQQRIVTIGNGPVERHARKQLARENNITSVSDVKVVQLRRAEARSYDKPGGVGASVEWSCRWVVNGHWRNQPYKDSRKPIYILPYVKGPDDKPLKVPTHTVYQVNR